MNIEKDIERLNEALYLQRYYDIDNETFNTIKCNEFLVFSKHGRSVHYKRYRPSVLYIHCDKLSSLTKIELRKTPI